MINWTTDSNEALCITLARPNAEQELQKELFHPAFTYPIFGEDEKIYGYHDLVIDLRLASGSLEQYLSLKYVKKLEASTTVDDVEATLSEFIPKGYCTDLSEFEKRVEDSKDFKPLGEKVHTYTRNNTEFEVYHATWSTLGFREYHERMQLFILLYIEGGSYINDDEDAWEFYTLYERQGTSYHFVGYSSLYSFYCFPEKIRLRLSQFVILPPYQRAGHGSELYNTIYRATVSRPEVAELTVEDPAEAFEDLRDRNDLKLLLGNEQFMREAFGVEPSHGGGRVDKRAQKKKQAAGKIGPPVDKGWSEKWRVQLKIAGRQFSRLVEMLIQLHLDSSDKRAEKAYRLQVKERVFRFNFEVLNQLEKEERMEKLEETFQNVRQDYERILDMIR